MLDDDYLLAGYRVATRADRQDWQDAGLPDQDLVSLSDCVVDVMPVDSDGWDHWFATLDDTEAARQGGVGWQVLAVGFAAADVPELLVDMADGGWDASAGSLPARLGRREPFVHTEGRLGYELVGFDSGRWHTWTCLGGLVADVRQATGVQPGRWGLIQDGREAHRAAQWLTVSGLGDPKVHLWTAALITDVTPGH